MRSADDIGGRQRVPIGRERKRRRRANRYHRATRAEDRSSYHPGAQFLSGATRRAHCAGRARTAGAASASVASAGAPGTCQDRPERAAESDAAAASDGATHRSADGRHVRNQTRRCAPRRSYRGSGSSRRSYPQAPAYRRADGSVQRCADREPSNAQTCRPESSTHRRAHGGGDRNGSSFRAAGFGRAHRRRIVAARWAAGKPEPESHPRPSVAEAIRQRPKPRPVGALLAGTPARDCAKREARRPAPDQRSADAASAAELAAGGRR